MLLGEKMPDRNDPKYKERYERDVEAGRKFAKATRITVVYRHQPAERTATEMQDSVLRERHRMLQEEELRETGTGNTNRSKTDLP